MSTQGDGADAHREPPLTPREVAERLRDAAGPSGLRDCPGICSIQRFNQLPSAIDLPGHRCNVLVGHLAGPFFAEADGSDEPTERRWISPGQVGINAAGQSVRRRFKGRPDVVLVHLDDAMMRGIVEDIFDREPAHIHLIPKLGEHDETAFGLIRLLLRETEQPMAGADHAIDGLSRALTVHALRFHSNLSAPMPTTLPALSPARLRRISDFMRANLDGPISLERLARVVGLSPSHFGRAFREATGQSPHRFLVALRVARSCELLEATDLPIVEIGLRCGFAQASHFATTFRKNMGATPREWRLSRRA